MEAEGGRGEIDGREVREVRVFDVGWDGTG